jgi:pyrimidine deaminase RibD-like protein
LTGLRYLAGNESRFLNRSRRSTNFFQKIILSLLSAAVTTSGDMTAAELQSDLKTMRLALALARRGYGATSPNPTVGAVLVKGGHIIGRGRTAPAGGPHAEIEMLRDARKRGHNPRGATLYATLEPCCTHGRTPPCTEAIIAAGIKRLVVGAVDPNPKHAGRGFKILRRAGIAVTHLGAAPFGVPRLRGPDRLKAELQTKSRFHPARSHRAPAARGSSFIRLAISKSWTCCSPIFTCLAPRS